MKLDDYMTPAEVCATLEISPMTMYRRRAAGVIPAPRFFGRQALYDRAEIEAIAATRKQREAA